MATLISEYKNAERTVKKLERYEMKGAQGRQKNTFLALTTELKILEILIIHGDYFFGINLLCRKG
jgi:hypothetical protein